MVVKRILVTGADGFAGRPLCDALRKNGQEVVEVTRQRIGNISGHTDWTPFLKNIDVVIHLANRAHTAYKTNPKTIAEFREINVEGTRKLAEQAAARGIKRFIYISSISVNGYKTGDKPFDENDAPEPHNVYGLSKIEAEWALQALAAKTSMEIVILRPPLIYGPGVKANFLMLLKVVNYCIPLPLAWVKNRRSFLGIDNFISAVMLCIEHPAAAGETFNVADDEAISTPELICTLAAFEGGPVQIFPFPLSALYAVGRVTGKEAIIDRLCASLEVNNNKLKSLLGWHPPLTLKEGLAKTVEWYISTTGKKLKWLKSVM